MTLRILMVGLLALLLTSCMTQEEKEKKAEDKGNAMVSIQAKLMKGIGDALKTDGKDALESASEGIGEVVKGVSKGYDNSISQAKVEADPIFLQTFEIGLTKKVYGNAETQGPKRIDVYLIANKAFDGKIKLRAFGADKKEVGRSVIAVKAESDGAQFYEFSFDDRTPMLLADHFLISIK